MADSGDGLPGFVRFYLLKARGVALALFLCGLAIALNASVWPLALTFAAIWLSAAAMALIASRGSIGA